MSAELNMEKVAELAKEIKDKVCLKYYPIGLSLIKSEDEIPKGARRPSQQGITMPVCLAENIVRSVGFTFAMTLEDHFCIMPAVGFGHIELPEYMKDGAMGSHHTKNKELGQKIQNSVEACFLKQGSSIGVVLTPATRPRMMPQGVIFYGNPSQIGKIAKGIAWYKGEVVPASAGGLAACVMAVHAIFTEKRPRVVLPCSGEKILGHAEEEDIFLATPVEELPDILEGMKATDFMLPYPTAKYMFFEPKVPASYPIDMKSYWIWKREGKIPGEKK